MPEPTTDPTPASMGEPLSEAERLAEIQARLDAVVPAGPWEVFDNGGTTNIVGEGGDPYVAHIGNSTWPGVEEMAAFIAAAPTDLRRLLDENARLTAELHGRRNLGVDHERLRVENIELRSALGLDQDGEGQANG